MKMNSKRPHMLKISFNSYEKNAVLDFCKELERDIEILEKLVPCQVCERKTKSGTLYFTNFFTCIMTEKYDVDSLMQGHLELCCYLGAIAKTISYAYPDSDCCLQIISPNTGAVETRRYEKGTLF